MDVDVEEFDQVNYAHLRDAQNLIDRIIDEKGYDFDLVLDVGCGSGRVTHLVDTRLHCRKVLAVDIDVKSIKYARNRYASPRIHYAIQDISLPWDELDPAVQQLEGKVDLIFSNRVLHWIENKHQAVANFYRLLKPGKCAYINTTTLWDLFYDLSEEDKAKYEEILHIPNEEEQVRQLKSLFYKNQFEDVQIESIVLRQLYPEAEFHSVVLPYFPNLTKKYMIEKDPQKRNQIMAKGLYEYVKNAFLRLYCREIYATKNGQTVSEFELTYGQIRIVAQK